LKTVSSPLKVSQPWILPSAVEWAQRVVSEHLRSGDFAVDGTAGNGYDTLFLAQKVSPGGRVFAFDIQESALRMTRQRVSEAGMTDERVITLCAPHETLADTLPAHLRGNVQAFMFNLGYLPGSDKSRVTTAKTTLRALASALDWLAPRGIMTVVIYPGHPGGAEEADAVRLFAHQLSSREVEVQQIKPVNRSQHPPECWVFLKR
jgi:predicted methyltransferase